MKSEPRVLPIVRVLSLTFVIVAARSVPLALMTRALEFRLQTVAELMSGASGSITTLILAYSGFGVWSLVLGNGIVAESALTMLAWIFSRWRPRLEFDGDELRSLLRFGVPQTVGVLLWQFYIDSDFLTVGILLGERILGWYTLAWQVAMVPVERLAAALNKANFPVFSSLMKDPAEARAHFRTMVRTIAGIAFPAAAGIAIVGPEFIHLVLKPKWMGAIPVVRQLSVLGALRAVGIVVPSLLSAAGKPKISMVYNIICSIAYPAIFVISAWRWGITGVAWAWVILYPVMTGFLIRMAIQRTPLELGDILTPLKYPLVGTAVMSLAVVMVGMSIQLSPLTHLGLQILTGVLVYASMAVGWLWRTGRLSSLRMGALRDT